VDLRRTVDGDRCARHYHWFDQSNCPEEFASAKPNNRSYIARGGGDSGTGTDTDTDTGTDLSARANSTSDRADRGKQPNLGMHDKRPKDLFR
jgi:hypothetical protein